MYYKVEEIELSGVVMPYRMDNLVLQEIQAKYNNVTDFLVGLLGYKKDENGNTKAEPSIEKINTILPAMIAEGYACMNKENPYTEAEIIRAIDKKPIELALLIHNEVMDCLTSKKKEKNQEPKKAKPMRK